MLDVGWSELLVIGVVALIVVGPKDLPKLFRSLGQWVGRARGLARDFQRAMNDAAEDSGMSDIKRSFDQAASAKNMGLDNWSNAMPKKDDAPNGKLPERPLDTPKSAETPAAKPAEAKPAAKKAAAKPAAKAAAKPAAKKPAAKKPAAKAEATPAAKKPATKKAST